MPLNRVSEIFLDTARPSGNVLRRSVNDPTPADTPLWIEADKFFIRIRFVEQAPDSLAGGTAIDLGDEATVILGAKRVRGSGNLLFSASNFQRIIVHAPPSPPPSATPEGEPPGNAPATPIIDVYYEARLNLNTETMPPAFGSDQSIQVWCDVELQTPVPGSPDPDRLTWQFPTQIVRQAYAGEVAPIPALPPYPSPDNLIPIAPESVGNFRFKPTPTGLLLQLKGRLTGTFYAPWVEGNTGAETLSFDAADTAATVPGLNYFALRNGANYRVIDTANSGTLLQIRHRVDPARLFTLVIDGEAGAETLGILPASATA